MAKTARKINNTTQRFIDILDIQDDIVLMSGGNACLVIEVKSTNFALLSAEEQDAKIFAYASLLNSLSFAIQIVIRSKRIDITKYLDDLGQAAAKTSNPSLARQINLYKDFVQELIKVNTVLDKTFYLVIPYSSLESGLKGAKQAVSALDENFISSAKSSLHSKAGSLHSQLGRINLRARTLKKDELLNIYCDIYDESS